MSNIRDSIRNIYSKNNLQFVFIVVTVLFILVYVFVTIITNGKALIASTCFDKNDYFMDYFNSIMYSCNYPYTQYHVIYPPLVTAIYGWIGEYLGMFVPYVDRWSFAIRGSYFGILSYFMFAIVAAVLLYKLYNTFQEKYGHKNEILSFILLTAFPLIYAFARGNSVVYSVIFILVFILMYNSEKKTVRYISYIALGIATGIKIFPAIFILLVLRERRYKEFIVCLITILIFLIVPFIFTDGNLMLLIDNTFNYISIGKSNVVANIQSMYSFLLYGSISNETLRIITYVTIFLMYLMTLIVVLFSKNKPFWVYITILSCALSLGFGTVSGYTFAYMVIPILFFLIEEKKFNRSNIVVLVCLVFISATYICDGEIITLAQMMSLRGWATIVLFLYLTIPALVEIYKNRITRTNDVTVV